MMGLDENFVLQTKRLQNDMSIMFLSAQDGEIKRVEQEAVRFSGKNIPIEKYLPDDHRGLVRACLQTGLDLKRECKSDGLNIIWSYQPGKQAGYVYVCGQAFSIMKPSAKVKYIPGEGAYPSIQYSSDGELLAYNSRVSELLAELDKEYIDDILSLNHAELINGCVKGRVILSDAKYINGKKYTWMYETVPDIDEISVYIRDFPDDNLKESELDESDINRDGLEFLSDARGTTKFINLAIFRLLNDLGVSDVADILSNRHQGLIKACLSTSTPLTEKCMLSNRTIVWTYFPHDDGKSVQVYGYDQLQENKF